MANRSFMFETRFVLNGFPKAGLHLLEAHISPIAIKLQGDESMHKGWTGTHRGNSFSKKVYPPEQIGYQLSRLHDGQYMKAHLAWSNNLSTHLYYLGHIHLFIYRDLRDVAVSLAHHILNPEGHAKHPLKEQFAGADLDDVLSFVIVGTDEYPGIVDRWRQYSTWLGDTCLSIRYEELVSKPKSNCKRILSYAISYLPERFNHSARMDNRIYRQVLQAMTAGNKHPNRSSTFRKGKPGEWMTTLTDKHLDEFQRVGGLTALQEMGYT